MNQLTKLDLIDEYRLAVNPMVLGQGNTLFKDLNDKIRVKLLKVKTLESGVVILYYARENK